MEEQNYQGDGARNFKTGDLVRIVVKEENYVWTRRRMYFTVSMKSRASQIIRVQKKYKDRYYKLSGNPYYWQDYMLEPVRSFSDEKGVSEKALSKILL